MPSRPPFDRTFCIGVLLFRRTDLLVLDDYSLARGEPCFSIHISMIGRILLLSLRFTKLIVDSDVPVLSPFGHSGRIRQSSANHSPTPATSSLDTIQYLGTGIHTLAVATPLPDSPLLHLEANHLQPAELPASLSLLHAAFAFHSSFDCVIHRRLDIIRGPIPSPTRLHLPCFTTE